MRGLDRDEVVGDSCHGGEGSRSCKVPWTLLRTSGISIMLRLLALGQLTWAVHVLTEGSSGSHSGATRVILVTVLMQRLSSHCPESCWKAGLTTISVSKGLCRRTRRVIKHFVSKIDSTVVVLFFTEAFVIGISEFQKTSSDVDWIGITVCARVRVCARTGVTAYALIYSGCPSKIP